MGATNFELTVYTDDDLKTAYRQAVDDALHEDGHDAYNGTISTTSGAVVSPIATTTPTPENQINWKALNERLDHINKWENCEAIPVYRVEPQRAKALAQIIRTIRIPSELAGTPGQSKAVREVLLRAVRKEIKETQEVERDPANIGRFGFGQSKSVRIPSPAKAYSVNVSRESLRPVAKATSAATSGKAETRYFIIRSGSNTLPAWEKGFPSQAKARENLPKDFTDTWGDAKDESWEVFGMTRRVEGEPLVGHMVTRKTSKTVEVAVIAEVVEVLAPERVTSERGWLFFGWAAC